MIFISKLGEVGYVAVEPGPYEFLFCGMWEELILVKWNLCMGYFNN
jgi:hypothetical protein